MKYKVSVVVPVYNGQKTLSACLDSLIKQDFDKNEFEIIVIDNGSTDATAEIVSRYPVRYVFFDRIKTSYAARNKGIEVAQGQLIAFIDADCWVDRGWLSSLVVAFKDKSIGGVGGRIVPDGHIRSSHQFLMEGKQKFLIETEEAEGLPWINTANAVYRKEVLCEVGYFNEYFVSGGDIDLGWRVSLKGYRLFYVPGAIVYHKLRENWIDCYREYFRVGYGQIKLYKRYAYVLGNMPVSFAGKLWWFWIGLCKDFLCRCIEATDIYHGVQFLFWDLVKILAQYSGNIYGCFALRNRNDDFLRPIIPAEITQNKSLRLGYLLDKQRSLVLEDGVIWWVADKKVYFFDVKSNNRLFLEESGAEFWKHLAEGKSFVEAAELVCREYEVKFEQLKEDLWHLIGLLEEQDLVRIEAKTSVPYRETARGVLS